MSDTHRSRNHFTSEADIPITALDLPKATVPSKTTLELHLELLERRFTMPANSPSMSLPESAKLGSPDSVQPTMGVPVTIGIIDQATILNTSNHSRHSFGFDVPSLSYQSLGHLATASQHGNDQAVGSFNQGSSVTSTTAPRASGHDNPPFGSYSTGGGSPSLVDVVAAAAKHMSKVAANHQGSGSNEESIDEGRNLLQSQNSNPTIVTAHLRQTTAATIVKETPPAFADAPQLDDITFEKPRLMQDLENRKPPPSQWRDSSFVVSDTENKPNGTKDKRKSVPCKREIHSVKNTIETERLTQLQGPLQEAIGMNSSASDSNKPESKRKRLFFDPPVARTAAKSTTMDPSGNVNDENAITSLKIDIISPRGRRKNTVSPLRSSFSNSPSILLARNEHSRDNSRSAKAASRPKSVTPFNNSSIYDFFPTTAKGHVGGSNKTASYAAKKSFTDSPKKPKARVSLEAPLEATQSSKQLHQQLEELAQLKLRYQELEQSCRDKDEQLKAVANNRTILHTALKTALQQREDELHALEQEKERTEAATRVTLEKLVRRDACQQAREIRGKLAADGARLGRIIYTRAGGMIGRSSHVETWEDGHATKELEARRSALSAKRATLEDRRDSALSEYARLKKQDKQPNDIDEPQQKHALLSNATKLRVVEMQEDVDMRSLLEATEALESASVHLSHLHQQEKELALEEQELNEEKGNHIRALKRVASEDSSRFRSRPKLHDRYVLQELLGKGGFSEVWRAYDLVELREVAVKIHQLDPRWPEQKKENYTKHVSREYEIHRNVRHPRIVSLYDVFEIDNNSFATVLECCNGTDLETLLKVKRRLPERDARSILLQIISGMHYLSHPSSDGKRQGIIHYDLKPGNILFDEYGDAKITDFGLSKIVDTPDPAESMELTSQGAGTYWYLPPECFVMTDNVRISNKVDVWSIGVIFYQMLFGKRPFGDGQTQEKIMSNQTMLNAHDVKFPDKPEVTKECKQFIRACLTYDQSFRPTIAQICENPYVISNHMYRTQHPLLS